MLIIHGDDFVRSRKRLTEVLKDKKQVLKFEAKEATVAQLMQVLGDQNLFGEKPTVVIFDLLSGASSNKDRLKELFKSITSENDLILYESKSANTNTIKSYANAKVELYKIDNQLFSFLEQIKPGNGRALLEAYDSLILSGEAPEMILFMVVRQLRILIMGSEEDNNLAVWQKKKLAWQLKYFDQKILEKLYDRIYKIDKRLKNGTGLASAETETVSWLLYLDKIK